MFAVGVVRFLRLWAFFFDFFFFCHAHNTVWKCNFSEDKNDFYTSEQKSDKKPSVIWKQQSIVGFKKNDSMESSMIIL